MVSQFHKKNIASATTPRRAKTVLFRISAHFDLNTILRSEEAVLIVCQRLTTKEKQRNTVAALGTS
jgi:hypothetical protein